MRTLSMVKLALENSLGGALLDPIFPTVLRKIFFFFSFFQCSVEKQVKGNYFIFLDCVL